MSETVVFIRVVFKNSVVYDTHTYTVYVFAVKGEPVPDNVLFFDRGGNDIEKIAKMLNTAEGTDEDNLISYGMISGTYTAE